MIIFIVLLSFIPSILIYILLRNNRKDDPDYHKDCRKALFGGMLCSFGVALFSLLMNILWNLSGIGKIIPVLNGIFYAFVLEAGSEELMKYLTARKIYRRDPGKTSWLDVISFVTIAGIGFGLLEDVIYAMSTNTAQIIVRGITAGHAAYGLLMGFFLGKSMQSGNKTYKFIAFFLPILLHGSYDLFLDEIYLDKWGWISLLIAVGLLIYIICMIIFIIKARKKELYTAPLSPEEPKSAIIES